jgi:hypothetical protein
MFETFDPETVASIPEPSACAMWLAGFAGLGFITRRQRLA